MLFMCVCIEVILFISHNSMHSVVSRVNQVTELGGWEVIKILLRNFVSWILLLWLYTYVTPFNPASCILASLFFKNTLLPGNSLSRERASPVRYSPVDAQFSCERLPLSGFRCWSNFSWIFMRPSTARNKISTELFSTRTRIFPLVIFIIILVLYSNIHMPIHCSLGFSSPVGEGGSRWNR